MSVRRAGEERRRRALKLRWPSIDGTVQARLRFQADVFWTKASLDPQVLHLWLDTYQTGKDFTRRGIVEVVVA